jgi:hypothetical protein
MVALCDDLGAVFPDTNVDRHDPCGFIFLITWRIARRFGGRGLAVVICVVAVVGPLRDSWYMATFPEWGSYAPGFAPMLATSGAYVLLGIIGLRGAVSAARRVSPRVDFTIRTRTDPGDAAVL